MGKLFSFWEFRVHHTLSDFVKMGPENDEDPFKNLQNHGCEFHTYQKTWNGRLVTFLFSSKGIPSTLNIPTPTPAPDHPYTRPPFWALFGRREHLQ